MQRADHDLAFMLQYENIAWYEDGKVNILASRIYPARIEFVTCHTHQEVAQAITDMVTQSAGPYTAVPMGMALAAHECRGRTAAEQMEYLRKMLMAMAKDIRVILIKIADRTHNMRTMEYQSTDKQRQKSLETM